MGRPPAVNAAYIRADAGRWGQRYRWWHSRMLTRRTRLSLDVVPGRGGMLSLDNGREQRFLTRSRVFTP